MAVLISLSDPRGPRAVAIASDSGQWIKCRDRRGRKMYGIRSSRDANRVYFVTASSCTCYDFGRGHECKHLLAVRLHCERMRQERQHELAQKHHDIFDRFDDDKPVTREDLARILGKPRRGVIPALRIVREA